MSVLAELAGRFRRALTGFVDDPEPLLDLLRPSQDVRFGDYQANFAMPLGKRLKRPPGEVAAEIVERVELADFCLPPEVAGPGFINLKLRDDWIAGRLAEAVPDPRLGISQVEKPRTYVIDYSAPNVAKPMHVGHIRSTVIGNSLYRTLAFLGHRVIGDNHLGDWGTQFGMIIYGYKHLLDAGAYEQDPVEELARLYRLVRQLMDHHEGQARLGPLEKQIAEQEAALSAEEEAAGLAQGKQPDKKTAKALRRREA
ncbi:MAG: arginine--tRNA ligase, partial [Planctomycetota bacterium]